MFVKLQKDVIAYGIKRQIDFDEEASDFAGELTYDDMMEMSSSSSGFIVWLTDKDAIIQPRVLNPGTELGDGADIRTSKSYTGAVEMAVAANFILNQVSIGTITVSSKTIPVSKYGAPEYTPDYFVDREIALSEYEFLHNHFRSAKSIFAWRRYD
jgi:hypothetical protein